MASQIRLNAGDIVTRSELAIEYGGSRYSGGIVPSDSSQTVFIFTDPTEGAQFGYVYDGFSPDGRIFHYTGAGQVGDQKETGSNSPILTAAEKGRTLHAFVAAGRAAGSTTKLQRYIGEFYLDPGHPYDRMPALDRAAPNGIHSVRTVIVFRLLPVHDVSPAIVASVGLSEVGPRALEVPIEINSTEFFETSGRAGQTAIRRESKLVDDFIASRPRHSYSRWAITIPSERSPLLTDIYDEDERILYEAKAMSGRSDVRMALGQLYDYRRHIDVAGLRCSVLLPERPTGDLRDFVLGSGLGLVFRESGGFVVEPSLPR